MTLIFLILYAKQLASNGIILNFLFKFVGQHQLNLGKNNLENIPYIFNRYQNINSF